MLMPKGAADCHLHGFGPRAEYPHRAPGVFPDPPSAPPDAAAAMLARLGLSRAVLVQTGLYGTDNRCQIDTARALNMQARVVVAVADGASHDDLARLHDAGARGARVVPHKGDVSAFDRLETLGKRITPLGWHTELLLKADDLAGLEPRLRRLPCPVVFDHFGAPDSSAGPRQPGFAALLRLLETGRCWVKLSAADVISRESWPHRDLLPYARALVAARPDRLVWGSDWPHAGSRTEPDAAALLGLLTVWAPKAAHRRAILVDNPDQLYGFTTA